MSSKSTWVKEHNGELPHTRIWTYRGDTDVPYVVDLGGGHVADFSPIINHDYFVRLNFVNQLSFMDRVYRGATHKRGEHCLGVFSLAQEEIRNPHVNLKPYGRLLLSLVGLLHDISHGPYSHVYEIVATDFGLPDHKEMGLSTIEKMKDIIEAIASEAGFETITVSHVVEDLIKEIREKGPIARLISDKDRLDKWDYIGRDSIKCRAGSVPDGVSLITNLWFDGKNSGILAKGLGALRGYLNAYTLNNTEFYKNKSVEAIEAFASRAIVCAMEDGFDLERGYSFKDGELDSELRRYNNSRRIFDSIQSDSHGQRIVVASIRSEGSGWLAKADGTLQIDEVTRAEREKIGTKVSIPKLLPLERSLMRNLDLGPEDFVVTSSPQIGRMSITRSDIIYFDENGNPVTENVFDRTRGLLDMTQGALEEHWAVGFVASSEKARKVADKINELGGPKKVLMEALEKES